MTATEGIKKLNEVFGVERWFCLTVEVWNRYFEHGATAEHRIEVSYRLWDAKTRQAWDGNSIEDVVNKCLTTLNNVPAQPADDALVGSEVYVKAPVEAPVLVAAPAAIS
jgi:hypothetical protein